jgi:hypothetical protein
MNFQEHLNLVFFFLCHGWLLNHVRAGGGFVFWLFLFQLSSVQVALPQLKGKVERG